MASQLPVDVRGESADAVPARDSEPPRPRGTRRTSWRRALRRDWQLYSLVVLPLLFFAIFRYLPMIGNVIAFRRFRPGGALLGEYWVGMHYFRLFWSDPTFWRVFSNTLIMGGLTLLFCFPAPIILALLLNEVRVRWWKRAVQTISYIPHFLSIVVVAGIVLDLVSMDGVVNQAVKAVGLEPMPFIQEAGWFR